MSAVRPRIADEGGPAEQLQPAGMSRTRAVAGALVVAVLLVTPASLLVWLRLRTEERLSSVNLQPAPVAMLATETLEEDLLAVVVALEWGDPLSVRSTGAAGVITAVMAEPGRRLRSGTVVYSVDGVERLAVATPRPFHRRLESGTRGEDVSMLQKRRTVLE